DGRPQIDAASFANNFRSAIRIRSYGSDSYYSWLPAAKYFKAHPESFALINGKRTAEGTGGIGRRPFNATQQCHILIRFFGPAVNPPLRHAGPMTSRPLLATATDAFAGRL